MLHQYNFQETVNDRLLYFLVISISVRASIRITRKSHAKQILSGPEYHLISYCMWSGYPCRNNPANPGHPNKYASGATTATKSYATTSSSTYKYNNSNGDSHTEPDDNCIHARWFIPGQ
jgi:hypothetical protein